MKGFKKNCSAVSYELNFDHTIIINQNSRVKNNQIGKTSTVHMETIWSGLKSQKNLPSSDISRAQTKSMSQ